MKTARFVRTDWLDLGLTALAEEGPPGLTIEALTARAGKTRGSFYAHFMAMADFRLALAGHWRETHTSRLKRDADAGVDALDRLSRLDAMAMRLDMRVEQAMRRLADADRQVAALVAEVDQERIAYLAVLYQASGLFDESAAHDLARFEYAAFVGFQQIAVTPDAARASYKTLLTRLMRA